MPGSQDWAFFMPSNISACTPTIKNRPKAVCDSVLEHALLYGFDHIFHDLLRITEDHHGFIHIEEFIV